MSRFWFRLTEVLPLAEHALACPLHRITAAQTIAGQRLRPALIWTRPWGRETLSSNGVPVWYGRYHDVVHGALAQTWWHPATNRRGSDEQPPLEHRFLPLQQRHCGDRSPLITLLREGARRGRHWLVVNTDPVLVDRSDRFEVRADRDDIVPADARWKQAVAHRRCGRPPPVRSPTAGTRRWSPTATAPAATTSWPASTKPPSRR